MAASRAKRLKRAVRFAAIRVALAGVRRLPVSMVAPLGRLLGALAFALLRGERRKALASLAVAFPEAREAEKLAIVRGMFVHLARSALELAVAHKLQPDLERRVQMPPEVLATYRAAIDQGRGVILVTGHVGNWELLGQRLARVHPISAIAKEANEPRLNALVERLRMVGNLRTIWRGGAGAARQMLGVVKAGEVLALLIDQDTKVQGVFVPFFGKAAFTPRAAAALALRGRTPVVAGFIHRAPDGTHRVSAQAIPLPEGNGEDAVVALTASMTLAIEASVRAAPTEWVWMHQRWKTRPDAEAITPSAPTPAGADAYGSMPSTR